MGRASASETVVAILSAFIAQRTWTQAALATHVGITVDTLRNHLDHLSLHIPLESERDHPHVYWTVPNRWFPAGVTITADQAEELLRQLTRAPESSDRDALLIALATATGASAPQGVDAGSLSDHDQHLRVLEDARATRTTVQLKYYSARTGRIDPSRHVSVQLILLGPQTRIIAHCHRASALRTYRLSRVQAAHLAPDIPFIPTPEHELDTFLASTVSGFRDPASPVPVAFTVRSPECRWVRDTLPMSMNEDSEGEHLRFTATTSSVLALARFVVGLGDAARALTPELERAVHQLAKGSLDNHRPTIRSVPPIRSTDTPSEAS